MPSMIGVMFFMTGALNLHHNQTVQYSVVPNAQFANDESSFFITFTVFDTQMPKAQPEILGIWQKLNSNQIKFKD